MTPKSPELTALEEIREQIRELADAPALAKAGPDSGSTEAIKTGGKTEGVMVSPISAAEELGALYARAHEDRRVMASDVQTAEAMYVLGGMPALLTWAEHDPGAFYRAWADMAPPETVRATLLAVDAQLTARRACQ